MRTETTPEQRAELRRVCGLSYGMPTETQAAILALLDERDALAAELARLRALVPAACGECRGYGRYRRTSDGEEISCPYCAPFGGRGAVMVPKT